MAFCSVFTFGSPLAHLYIWFTFGFGSPLPLLHLLCQKFQRSSVRQAQVFERSTNSSAQALENFNFRECFLQTFNTKFTCFQMFSTAYSNVFRLLILHVFFQILHLTVSESKILHLTMSEYGVSRSDVFQTNMFEIFQTNFDGCLKYFNHFKIRCLKYFNHFETG